jgi:CDP-glucose 4,6-dehydratase
MVTPVDSVKNAAAGLAGAEVLSADFWRGRRVLLTGHTGFKGSWLALWLVGMGAKVTGLSCPPKRSACSARPASTNW